MVQQQTIASALGQVQINPSSLVSESQMLSALDRLALNCGLQEYNRDVFEELWAETPKQPGNKVYARDFIAIVAKGGELVSSSIASLERDLDQFKYQPNADPEAKNSILQDIASYSQDLKYLTMPFGAQQPRQSQLYLAQSQASAPGRSSRFSGHTTVIFAKQIPEKQSGSSTDLKIVFLLTCVLALLEMIVMFHKHHFLSLLAYMSVFAIFFVGYFDLHYMKFVKLLLLVSVVLDIVWIFVDGPEYWNAVAETQHSVQQGAFLKLIIFMVIIMDAFKLIIIAILFKYRNNPQSLSKQVQMCGTYNLSSRRTNLYCKATGNDQ